jgi:hypothetical protein
MKPQRTQTENQRTHRQQFMSIPANVNLTYIYNIYEHTQMTFNCIKHTKTQVQEKLLFVLIRMLYRGYKSSDCNRVSALLSSLLFVPASSNEYRYKRSFYKRGLLELFPPSHLLSFITLNGYSMVV